MLPTLTVMKHFALILLAALTWSVNAQTTCVDPLACNFTELGECEFLDDNGMPCVTEGCAIPGACNFNPEADINDGSCEFTSCLGCTDEAACNYDPEAVYLDMSCIYFVDCNGVCGGDWIEDDCGNCYSPGGVAQDNLGWTFMLNSCGAVGAFGPSQADCDLEYGEGIVASENGIQVIDVPYSGVYEFEAVGAGQWGAGGAEIVARIALVQGEQLRILVGQMGDTSYGCGHGGTFVATAANVPLVVAGGGAGVTNFLHPNCVGSIEECGNAGNLGYGGCGGTGGDASEANHGFGGGGGGGFYTDGEYEGGWYESDGGKAFVNGGFGGTFGSRFGGFGGGGSGYDNDEPAGGGGYSGGGGGGCDCEGAIDGGDRYAGGGGSFTSESSEIITETEGSNVGDGYVLITLVNGYMIPDCLLGCAVEQACNFNPEATNDDGSCDFCFCGPGTEYDIELGQCMIVNGSSDINGDGCTNLNDLLDLLSGYGTCED